ncbi:MAG: RdgB/HAM1 family non-canonical purine NTP pyrophosphatase [Bacilli bacterium]|nr:RdgB/HAM1 family non-canonical purine NTP pyrophosphatase [Bacilli bacterium]
MVKKIVLATNNAHKVQEFQKILSPLGYEVVTPKSLGVFSDPEETGKDYKENAYIKAKGVADKVDLPVISDDSGFEVNYLNGFPGIYSARFCEENGGDYRVAGSILSKKIPDGETRDAAFRCIICYLENKDAVPQYFEGLVPGRILKEAAGEGGFGYDPWFHCNEIDKDFGLVDEATKNEYSHRGKASKKLVEYLSMK